MTTPSQTPLGDRFSAWVRNIFHSENTGSGSKAIPSNAQATHAAGSASLNDREPPLSSENLKSGQAAHLSSKHHPDSGARNDIIIRLESWAKGEKPTPYSIALLKVDIIKRNEEIKNGSEWAKVRHHVARLFGYSKTAEAESKYNQLFDGLNDVNQQKNIMNIASSFMLSPEKSCEVKDVELEQGKYSGQVKDGIPEGEGELLTEEGSFKGTFKEGVFVKGLHEDTDIVLWDGEFDEEGKLQGQGSKSYGQVFEKGEFVDGELIRGRRDYLFGDFEEGPFVDGKLHGEGIRYDKISDSYQEGQFERGIFVEKELIPPEIFETPSDHPMPSLDEIKKPDVKTLVLPKGTYQGSIQNDMPQGKGELTTSTGEVYIGVFDKGEFVHGEFKKSDGSVQSGSFKNWVITGKGTLTFAMGTKEEVRYEGTFSEKGILQGEGKIIFANGKEVNGGFSWGIFVFPQ